MVVNRTQDLLKVSRDGSGSGVTQNFHNAVLLDHLPRDPPVLETMLIHTLLLLLALVHEIHVHSVELTHHLGVANALCIFVPHRNHSLDYKKSLPERPFRAPGLALLNDIDGLQLKWPFLIATLGCHYKFTQF